MNLAMRVRVKVSLSLFIGLVQVGDMHRNHGSLFLLNVKELDKALLQCVVEVHALCLIQALDMLLFEKNLVSFNNKERSLDSTSISVEANLLVGYVSHDRHLLRDLIAPAQVLNLFEQKIRVIVCTEPVAVDENFDVFTRSNHRLIPLFEFLNAEVFQNRDKATD